MDVRAIFSKIRTTGLLLAMTGALAGCDDPSGPGGSGAELYIDQTGLVLGLGDSVQLTARFRPEPDALIEPATEASWSTADEAVARVSDKGRVEALSPGRAIIRVAMNGVRDSGTVVVRDPEAPYSTRWARVSVGGTSVCALTVAGEAYCWGDNWFAQLGSGARRRYTIRYSPGAVVGGHAFVDIAVGYFHACGLKASGEVYCWGDNPSGQLGIGHNSEEPFPSPQRVSTSRAFRSVDAGDKHSCGLDTDGVAFCWGNNIHGQIGDGTMGIRERRPSPTLVDTDLVFETLALGASHTCGLTPEGAAYCWGSGFAGSLGAGYETGDRPLPLPVAGEHSFRHLSARCGITTAGETYCWGWNNYLQLGVDTINHAVSPVRPALDPGYTAVVAGGALTCGLQDERAQCWGSNHLGGLGAGEVEGLSVCNEIDQIECTRDPLPVYGDLQFAQISAGRYTVCGITVEEALYCWGANGEGLLGNGSIVEFSAVPVRVADPVQ